MILCTTFTWKWDGYRLTQGKHKKYFLQKCMHGSILLILIIMAHCSTISNSFLQLFFIMKMDWSSLWNGPFYDFPTLFVARLRHLAQMANFSSVSFTSVLQFTLFSLLRAEYLSVFFFSPPPDFWFLWFIAKTLTTLERTATSISLFAQSKDHNPAAINLSFDEK